MLQDLHGVVGGRNVGLKPNSDLSILSDSVSRNVEVLHLHLHLHLGDGPQRSEDPLNLRVQSP